MRTTILIMLSSMWVLATTAGAQESPSKPEATKAETEEFVPPDGWKPKKRGKFTLYCRKEAVMGTRFPTETCYDEEGIRAMLAAQLDDREKVDQLRRICGSQAACGAN